EFEHVLHVATTDEVLDFSIRVAGDVREDGAARRFLDEPVDRHHREEVIDRPGIGEGLKNREITEICVGERARQPLELLGNLIQLARELVDLVQQAPEDVFGEHALAQGQVPQVEELEALLLELDGVVVRLLEVLARDLVVGVEEVAHYGRGIVRELVGHRSALELGGAEDVVDEHRVVRYDRAARLRNDVRMAHARLVADFRQAEDRKSTRLNSSHVKISYAVFCLKKKNTE